MKHLKRLLLTAGLGFAFLSGLTNAQAADQDNPKDKLKKPTAKPAPGAQPGGPGTRPGGYGQPGGPGTRPAAPGTRPSGSGTPTDGTKTSPATPGTTPSNPATPGPGHATPSTPTDTPTVKTPSVPTTRGSGNDKPIESGTVKTPSAPASRGPFVKPPPVPLATKTTPNGGYVKTAPSGQVREKMEKKPDGEHIQHIAPTGRVATEVVKRPDGTEQTKYYAPNGKVQKEVVVNKDGTQAITTHQMGRDGTPRVQETINVDNRGRQVSKTVVVKNTTIVNNNITVVNNNTTIVKNYDRGHYGYVYRPVYVVNSPVFVSWYDPYWYTPAGVVIVHPFHYSWGWDDYGWYRHHRHYWVTYDVYPTPAYWVTDWLIAGYVADRYAASVSVAQAQEEARLAREDAAHARLQAEQAREQAERAEAQGALNAAEARATAAEARAARAEAEEAKTKALAGKPNPKATPIDEQTKATLKDQIEKEIAQKKTIADETAKGAKLAIPDLSQALADPKHIYPVSKTTSVISAKDQNPAGNVTEGDLLKLEPGQESALKDANETTFITMRVMTSKGEDGEVTAGTLISVPLRDLQEFDSEFRAKLDQGLAEADKNKDLFKKGS